MKTLFLLLSLAAYSQETPTKPAVTRMVFHAGEASRIGIDNGIGNGALHTSGDVTRESLFDTPRITIDTNSKYSRSIVIIRNPSSEPIAFCNIRMAKCWSLK